MKTNRKNISQLFTTITAVLSTTLSAQVSALTYQNSTDVQFTINPSIGISLSSSDLIIDNLAPSSSSDSNVITVNVATNAENGYYMSATAGTSTGNTNLANPLDNNHMFTSLSSNVATLNAIPDNQWGYSYSTDNGSTWISGSQGNTSLGYNGLPLDNDDSGATGVILANTDSYSNAGSVKFKIAAHASPTQASGTYTNTVNFYAVANPEPPLSLQNLSLDQCPTDPTIAVDSRDGTEYHIQRLADGRCWMLDNLALDIVEKKDVLNSTNTNASDTTLAYLKGINTGTTSDQYPTSGVAYFGTSTYSIPQINISDKETIGKEVSATGAGFYKVGVRYNFCAVSAGSYCYGDGTSYAGSPTTDPVPNSIRDITEDICPAGWHVPTMNAVANNLGEYNILSEAMGNDIVSLTGEAAAAYRNALSIPTPDNMYWIHASTWEDISNFRMLWFSTANVYIEESNPRNGGVPTRCILSN